MFARFVICTNFRLKLKKKLARSLKDRVIFSIKAMIPNPYLPLPLMVWKALFRLYFAFVGWRRGWYQTVHEKKYQYAVDETGALLPRNLKKGKISTGVLLGPTCAKTCGSSSGANSGE